MAKEERLLRKNNHPKLKPGVSLERLQRQLRVEKLLLDGHPEVRIHMAIVEVAGPVSLQTIKKDITAIRKRWLEEDVAHREYARSMSMRRLFDEIRYARKDGRWSAVASLERLLAQIQGTLAPDNSSSKQDDDRATLLDYLMSITDEDLDREVSKVRKLESLEPEIIDVEGEELVDGKKF